MTTRSRVNGATNAGVVSMTILDCSSCGVIYGITAEFEDRRRGDAARFYCPNGHGQSYGESEADREREKAAILQRRLTAAEGNQIHLRDQLETTERQRRAAKGQVTKIKNRIAAGVCPCCRRTFQDLQRHMAGQHPDFAPGGDHA